jgi:hypothetical protein
VSWYPYDRHIEISSAFRPGCNIELFNLIDEDLEVIAIINVERARLISSAKAVRRPASKASTECGSAKIANHNLCQWLSQRVEIRTKAIFWAQVTPPSSKSFQSW